MKDQGASAEYDWEHYELEFVNGTAYVAQEVLLSSIFAMLPEPGTILEVGPGLGRITRMALIQWPMAAYSASDIAMAPLAEAERLSGGLTHSYLGPIQADGALAHPEFAAGVPRSVSPQVDLVIAIEVLMHVPPEGVAQAIGNMLSVVRTGGHLVTCDWTGPVEGPVRVQNYLHDYVALFNQARARVTEQQRTGYQTLFVVKP